MRKVISYNPENVFYADDFCGMVTQKSSALLLGFLGMYAFEILHL